MAAAIGSSMMKAAAGAGPSEVDSTTARRSAPVMPEGTHPTTRGLAMSWRRWVLWTK